MPVKTIPQKFKASDGTEFKTEADAQRHEAVVIALQKFDEARQQLAFATIKTHKTADGIPFDFDSHRDYYFIQRYQGWPEIRKVGLWGWYNQKFCLDGERLKVIEGDGQNARTFDVAELYRSEKAAVAVLTEERKKYIEELQARM